MCTDHQGEFACTSTTPLTSWSEVFPDILSANSEEIKTQHGKMKKKALCVLESVRILVSVRVTTCN